MAKLYILGLLLLQSLFSCSQASRTTNYIIPVVFHVIHENGAENISEEQILDQIRILNRDFSNPDTSIIIDSFKPLVADCEIEFRLATRDPQGNCTNGITRHVSSLTQTGNHQVKSIVHWPPNQYLNFYTVVNAAGLAGHALLPSQADSNVHWDGIVMGHNYIGSIGTSTVQRSVVATHEIGHYLGLEHVWGGNNVPNFPYLPVNQASNCGTDDGIGDTPNTIGNVSCNLTQMNCGTLDNVQNFMDYSYCGAMFTLGQKARMHQTLNDTIANRNNLWQQNNLIATGTTDTSLCFVKLGVEKTTFCAGDTLKASDLSYNGVVNRTFTLVGPYGNPLKDSIVVAGVAYLDTVLTIPGNYSLTLTVDNGVNSFTTDKTPINVLSNPGIRDYLADDVELVYSVPNENWFLEKQNPTFNWELNTQVGRNSAQSFYIKNVNDKGLSILQSQTVDLSNRTNVELSFWYAFAPKTTGAQDRMQVFFSNDCGETWFLRGTLFSGGLATNYDFDSTEFIPAANDWNLKTIVVPSNYFTPNFRFKISFSGTDKGNNVYLDDINLVVPGTIGITEKVFENLNIYPNPTHNELKITHAPHGATVTVYDTSGKKLLKDIQVQDKETNISLQSFPEGNYVVLLTYKGIKTSQIITKL